MSTRTPYRRADDNELLGYISHDTTGWQAQTIFGYPIARADSKQEVEKILKHQGLSFLTGVWQYYDTDDRDWFPCVIREAFGNRVVVVRTNAMGYEDPDDRKIVTIEGPTEDTLIKSA